MTATTPTWGSPKPKAQVLVHSWTSVNDFNTCPFRFYKTRVVPKSERPPQEPMGANQMFGNEGHIQLERAAKNNQPLPEPYAKYQPVLNRFMAVPGIKLVEWQFGITRNWTTTGFFDNDVWIRGKIDLAVVQKETALAVDWKFGKIKEEYGQLELFATAMWARYPQLKSIKTIYAWLPEADPKKMFTPEDFSQDALPEMKQKIAFRIEYIEDCNRRNVWPKQSSGLCKAHCPVSRKDCEYQGRNI